MALAQSNVSDFGAPTPPHGSQQQAIRQILAAPEVGQIARESQARNRATLDAVPAPTSPNGAGEQSVVQQRANRAVTALVHGRHVVVSAGGGDTIAAMLELARAPAERRPALLRTMINALNDGQPEAQVALGWLSELGLYGVPQDINKAVRLYQAAAAQQYQPAIYNLALLQAYGRTGGSPNPADALQRLSQAMSLGRESSYRVCSMASFLAFRARRPEDAQRFSDECKTPLGMLPRVAWSKSLPMADRVRFARDSYAAGVDDGIDVIVSITRDVAVTDPQQHYCKYRLLQLWSQVQGRLPDAARACYMQVAGLRATDPLTPTQQSFISGISGFVPIEREQLRQLRASHRFRHDISVPFLPFSLTDLSAFEPELKRASGGGA
jgi:hypothetical protein